MPPKKQNTQTKSTNTYRDNYMKDLNSRVQQQNKQMASINLARSTSSTRATPTINNSTFRNDYIQALKTQTKLNEQYLKADPKRKDKLENPLWYQKKHASPIDGMNNNDFANRYARPLNYDANNSSDSDSDSEELKYGYIDDNNNNLYAQAQNHVFAQPQNQAFTQVLPTQTYASVVKEPPPEVKYYKSSDNFKFISKISSTPNNSLLNEKTELLNKYETLKGTNDELRNEIVTLQNNYNIQISIDDKILVIDFTELEIEQQNNILMNYIEIFTNDNQKINQQITTIKTIFS